ncbi:hypothetical protein K437DRAFT_275117 [Tilletiaria anomala UBC 951]|uniref:Matrin-type domain-containing protein n=1 Tax=Tilletiaria anomala (strain ATCC 24038 / CBS 436.72 / UBC 951) TaxID=1037660 RepID=A0A066VQS0_TILAU|nr:uncharacterized protein K437DRAFT_275117 [Tilletiaria anomala UBC 951]KDN42623.1 hypothetical protein K437DRAFT_275117 [Tilletiaria anomala UBC 951]
MTEYWISRKRWTCPYCDITINDDVPSRQQHENGLRHKGNVERALKNVYKQSHLQRKEKSDAAKEMKRIEAAAKAAMEKDSAAFIPVLAAVSPSAAAGPSKAAQENKSAPGKPAAWKPKDPYSVYGNVASDYATSMEEAQKGAQEEEERRRQEGTASEWSVVEPSAAAPRPADAPSIPHASTSASTTNALTERDEARQFRVRERQVAFDGDSGGSDDGHRASGITGEIRVKKRVRTKTQREAEEEEDRKKRTLPEWKPLKIVEDSYEGEGEVEAPVGSSNRAHSDDASERPPVHLAAGEVSSAAKEEEQDTPSVSVEIASEPLSAGGARTLEQPTVASATGSAVESAAAAVAPAAAAASAGGMFKRRKGGANRDTKKIFV